MKCPKCNGKGFIDTTLVSKKPVKLYSSRKFCSCVKGKKAKVAYDSCMETIDKLEKMMSK